MDEQKLDRLIDALTNTAGTLEAVACNLQLLTMTQNQKLTKIERVLKELKEVYHEKE